MWDRWQYRANSKHEWLMLLAVLLLFWIENAAKSNWSSSPLTEWLLSSVPTPCQICSVVDAIAPFAVEQCHWCALISVFYPCQCDARFRQARLAHIRPSRHCWIVGSLSYLRCCSPIAIGSSSVCLPTRAVRIRPLVLAKLSPIQQSPTSRSWLKHCFCFLRQMTIVHQHSPQLFQRLALSRYAPFALVDSLLEQCWRPCCQPVQWSDSPHVNCCLRAWACSTCWICSGLTWRR